MFNNFYFSLIFCLFNKSNNRFTNRFVTKKCLIVERNQKLSNLK